MGFLWRRGARGALLVVLLAGCDDGPGGGGGDAALDGAAGGDAAVAADGDVTAVDAAADDGGGGGDDAALDGAAGGDAMAADGASTDAQATDAQAADAQAADAQLADAQALDAQAADAALPPSLLCASATCRFQSHVSLDTTFQVAIDAQGGKWFATTHGAVYLDDRGTPTDVRDDLWNAWTLGSGIPASDVRAVTVAPDGSKWFSSAKTTSPGTSYVSRLFDNGTPLVSSDDLWVNYGVPDGLPNNLTSGITVDGSGGVWLANGGGGLYYLDDGGTPRNKADDSITRLIHTQLNGVPWYSLARTVRIGPDGAKWVVSGDATLCRIDDNGTPKVWTDDVVTRFTYGDGFRDFGAWDFAFDAAGNVWVGTTQGLEYLDFNGTVTNKADDRYAFFGMAEPPRAALYQGRRVWIDGQGNKWVGHGGGLTQLRDGGTPLVPGDDQYTYITGLDGLEWESINWFAVAADGAMWVVSGGGGAVRFDHRGTVTESDDVFTHTDSFQQDDYLAAVQSAAGHLWVGTSKGFTVFDDRGTPEVRSDDRFVSFREADGLPGDNVRELAFDSAGAWFATHIGIAFMTGSATPFDKSDDAWTTWGVIDGLANYGCYAIAVDGGNGKWIGTGSGLSYLDDKGTPSVKAGDSFTTWRIADGLSGDFIRDIAFEGSRVVWLATENGVTRLDNGGTPSNKADDTYTIFRMSDGLTAATVMSLAVDSAGRKWFAPLNGGINVLTDGGTAAKGDDSWTAYGVANGLPHVAVEDIVAADATSMWLADAKGLVHFDHKGTIAATGDDVVSVIDTGHGLAGDWPQVIAVEAPKRLAVGTKTGLSRVFLP